MILLDTNVLIGLVLGRPLRPGALVAIKHAEAATALLVSATSAWEIGLLATRTRRTGEVFAPDARRWFATAMRMPGVRPLPFNPEMALEAIYLPGNFHWDPADRWLLASARIASVPLVTKDRAILAYAAAGHVEAIAA